MIEVARQMGNICNSGYTFDEARRLILLSWMHNSKPDRRFYQTEGKNLIKQQVFYHNRLKVLNPPPVMSYDINTCEYVTPNEDRDRKLEPVASITLDEIRQYLYDTNMVDKDVYPTYRVDGLLKHYIKRFGVELTLYCIDAAAESRHDWHQKIDIKKIDDYITVAKNYRGSQIGCCQEVQADRVWIHKRFKSVLDN